MRDLKVNTREWKRKMKGLEERAERCERQLKDIQRKLEKLKVTVSENTRYLSMH